MKEKKEVEKNSENSSPLSLCKSTAISVAARAKKYGTSRILGKAGGKHREVQRQRQSMDIH